MSQCGGGLFAHRYSADRGFDNPSVYCPDLMERIQHIRRHPPRGPAVRDHGADAGRRPAVPADLGAAVLAGYAHLLAVVDVSASKLSLPAGDHVLAVRDMAQEQPGWVLSRGVRPGLLLEDADPCRDCHK
ncbi:hypothetical protein [Dactylosporangium sp. NBC_01737]|uniref:hypothetical protein n=1 Tax=Dactylosporangium sp. NBC_01737 TaxID=2975959 RepID=UPI003FA3ABB0